MTRYPLSMTLPSLGLMMALATTPARAQYDPACYAPPAISYYAPVPAYAAPAPQYFAGNNYSFYSAPTVSAGFAAVPSYYRPMPILRPFYYQPGPYYYTPTAAYTPGYYSYYSSPRYFRY